MADTAVTISRSKVSVIPLPERNGGFTHKFHVDYSDVNTGAGSTDTVTMALGSTPANWVVTRALAIVTTAFAGTTGGFAMQVGTSSSAAIFLPNTSVLTAGSIYSTNGINVPNTVASCKGTSAATLQATFTNSVSGSPAGLTAGGLDVFLTLFNPTQIDGAVNNV